MRLSPLDCSSYANGGTLTTDASGNVVCAADDGGAGSTVAGADTQIQFNNGGSFGAAANFTFSSSTGKLAVPYASTTALTTGTQWFPSLANSGLGVDANGKVYAAATSTLATISGILPIGSGGTGTSTPPTYGKLLVGNSAGGYDLLATSSLGITGGGAATWSTITGTLSSQTDLQNALDAKLSLSSWYATTTDGLAQGTINKYYSTLLFAADLAGTTTDALAQGSVNKYYAGSLVQAFVHSSTTIPKTYTANTFTALQTITNASTTNLTASYASSTQGFFGSLAIGNFSGFLKATAGAVASALINLASDVTGTLGVGNGGTGWANIAASAIPFGNGSGALATTTAGTNGSVLAYLNGIPTWTATTTFSAPLTYSGGAVSIAAANGSTDGFLTSGDWTTFNSKQAALSSRHPLQNITNAPSRPPLFAHNNGEYMGSAQYLFLAVFHERFDHQRNDDESLHHFSHELRPRRRREWHGVRSRDQHARHHLRPAQSFANRKSGRQHRLGEQHRRSRSTYSALHEHVRGDTIRRNSRPNPRILERRVGRSRNNDAHQRHRHHYHIQRHRQPVDHREHRRHLRVPVHDHRHIWHNVRRDFVVYPNGRPLLLLFDRRSITIPVRLLNCTFRRHALHRSGLPQFVADRGRRRSIPCSHELRGTNDEWYEFDALAHGSYSLSRSLVFRPYVRIIDRVHREWQRVLRDRRGRERRHRHYLSVGTSLYQSEWNYRPRLRHRLIKRDAVHRHQ